jgi:hypothetical protein
LHLAGFFPVAVPLFFVAYFRPAGFTAAALFAFDFKAVRGKDQYE